jgi:hypothetical protein
LFPDFVVVIVVARINGSQQIKHNLHSFAYENGLKDYEYIVLFLILLFYKWLNIYSWEENH